MRCLTLADALAERGADCRFIHRAHPGHMADTIRARGYEVALLPQPDELPHNDGADDYASWLGVAGKLDAEQTIRSLNGEWYDWVVVDHYAIDAVWERHLRPHTQFIAVIDDMAHQPHDADFLLNQNFNSEAEERYYDLVPADATCLCGPKWALLDPAYAQYHTAGGKKDARVKSVFVFFGGSDTDNLSGRVLQALSSVELSHLRVNLVLGANNPNRSALESQAARRGRVALHGPQPALAGLMADADLAIGAGGATTWERCCMGLPSLVISLAENQRPACEALASTEIISYLGHYDQVTPSAISSGIQLLLADTESRTRMARKGMDMVDGLGANRVAEFMVSKAITPEKVASCR